MERVNFYNQNKLKNNMEDVFIFQRKRIKECIPHADIPVRVSSQQFPQAVKALSILYDINDGSVKINEIRAFNK